VIYEIYEIPTLLLPLWKWTNTSWKIGLTCERCQTKAYLTVRGGVIYVYKSLWRIQPKHTKSPVRFVGHHQWHRSIQAEATVQVVGEDIQVIQPIGFAISAERNTFWRIFVQRWKQKAAAIRMKKWVCTLCLWAAGCLSVLAGRTHDWTHEGRGLHRRCWDLGMQKFMHFISFCTRFFHHCNIKLPFCWSLCLSVLWNHDESENRTHGRQVNELGALFVLNSRSLMNVSGAKCPAWGRTQGIVPPTIRLDDDK